MAGFSKLLDKVFRGLDVISKWLALAAGAALLCMMALVNANVLLRPLGKPIWGTYELVGFLGAIVLSFALLRITLQRGHMAVEVLTSRLPQRARRILSLGNRILGALVMALVAWQSVVYGNQVMLSGEVSSTLRLPFHPLLYGIAFAFGTSSLIFAVDLLRRPRGGYKNE